MTQQQSISSIKTIIAFICWAKKTPESSSGHSRLTLNHGVSNGLHRSLWSDHGFQNHWNYSEPILGSHPESSQICSNFQWDCFVNTEHHNRGFCARLEYILSRILQPSVSFGASLKWVKTQPKSNRAHATPGYPWGVTDSGVQFIRRPTWTHGNKRLSVKNVPYKTFLVSFFCFIYLSKFFSRIWCHIYSQHMLY